MKKYLFALIGFTLFTVACQSNKTDQTSTDSLNTVAVTEPVAQQTCYAYTKNRDTASLSFIKSGSVVTGELNYRLFEKDSNKGMIKGVMHGDTLLAEYTFNSEGRESVRQVAFIKKGDQLLEGYGDVKEKDGKMVFKNTQTLTFGQAIVFSKVDCR